MKTVIVRKPKTEKLIESAFKVCFDCVQIPIMDIPKIYARARKHIENGEDSIQVMHNISLEYKNQMGAMR